MHVTMTITEHDDFSWHFIGSVHRELIYVSWIITPVLGSMLKFLGANHFFFGLCGILPSVCPLCLPPCYGAHLLMALWLLSGGDESRVIATH